MIDATMVGAASVAGVVALVVVGDLAYSYRNTRKYVLPTRVPRWKRVIVHKGIVICESCHTPVKLHDAYPKVLHASYGTIAYGICAQSKCNVSVTRRMP